MNRVERIVGVGSSTENFPTSTMENMPQARDYWGRPIDSLTGALGDILNNVVQTVLPATADWVDDQINPPGAVGPQSHEEAPVRRQASLLGGTGDNTMLYVLGGAALLLLAMNRKKK